MWLAAVDLFLTKVVAMIVLIFFKVMDDDIMQFTNFLFVLLFQIWFLLKGNDPQEEKKNKEKLLLVELTINVLKIKVFNPY